MDATTDTQAARHPRCLPDRTPCIASSPVVVAHLGNGARLAAILATPAASPPPAARSRRT